MNYYYLINYYIIEISERLVIIVKYYSIKDVSNATGLTSYTIRYYEKIGFLPWLKRDKNGVRIFTESDIKYLECLIFFKKIGMSLDDIKEIIKEGCMIKDFKNGLNVHDIIQKRLNILDTHIQKLKREREELDKLIAASVDRRNIYKKILKSPLT